MRGKKRIKAVLNDKGTYDLRFKISEFSHFVGSDKDGTFIQICPKAKQGADFWIALHALAYAVNHCIEYHIKEKEVDLCKL